MYHMNQFICTHQRLSLIDIKSFLAASPEHPQASPSRTIIISDHVPSLHKSTSNIALPRRQPTLDQPTNQRLSQSSEQVHKPVESTLLRYVDVEKPQQHILYEFADRKKW